VHRAAVNAVTTRGNISDGDTSVPRRTISSLFTNLALRKVNTMVDMDIEPVAAGEVHLRLHGRLDDDGAARLRTALTTVLNDGRYHTIGLNLRELTGIDPAGIATLAVARRICASAGVRLLLTGGSTPSGASDSAVAMGSTSPGIR
jgi:anti-anti-sigma regulatory factor